MIKVKPEKGILTNGELYLTGVKFSASLEHYRLYLFARNYGVFSESGNSTTVDGYCYAIKRIMEEEGVTFEELYDKADYYVNIYGTEGPKRKLGDTSRGTWRNALNRFLEFKQYIDLCERKKNPTQPPVYPNISIEEGELVEHHPAPTQNNKGQGRVTEVNQEKGMVKIAFESGESWFSFDAVKNGLIRKV